MNGSLVHDRNWSKRFKRNSTFLWTVLVLVRNIFSISQWDSIKSVMWKNTLSRKVKKYIYMFIEGKKIILSFIIVIFLFDWCQLEPYPIRSDQINSKIRFAHWNRTERFTEPNRTEPLNKTLRQTTILERIDWCINKNLINSLKLVHTSPQDEQECLYRRCLLKSDSIVYSIIENINNAGQ